ncbi:MAG: LLM class flavin-dependent oxidoreductase, partial [Actinobacteria bacterium]|nr:LLM class flavin-dependent oxidoreductase [Actinomycetota bacterium]
LANTETLKVATGIAHIYGRDPIASAQAALTLSELYDGRFIQGLGLSHPSGAALRGVDWEDPSTKARTYLTALRGELPIRRVGSPAPVPLFLAAHGPKMLAVAAEVADGANVYMQTPERCAEARAILGPDKTLNLLLPMCLTDNPDEGRAAGRRALGVYLPLPAYHRGWRRSGFDESDWSGGGSDRLVDANVAWGSIATIESRLREFRDAGVDHVIIAANAAPGRPESANELVEALAPGR